MLFLQISSLIVATTAALIGIWTGNTQKKKIPLIASALAVLGVVIGIAIVFYQENASSKEEDSVKQRHKQLIQENGELRAQIERIEDTNQLLQKSLDAVVTSTPLKSLHISWSIPVDDELSRKILLIETLSQAIIHDERISDDEIDRLSEGLREQMITGWQLNVAWPAWLLAISDPAVQVNTLYPEKTFEYARKLEKELFDEDIYSGPGTYTGPDVTLWFPFNQTLDSAVPLGQRYDDPDEDEELDDPFMNYVHQLVNFGFKLDAGIQGDHYVLNWKYDHATLKQVVSGENPTLAFPGVFNMILVIDGGKDSFQSVQSLFQEEDVTRKQHSTLTLQFNGLKDQTMSYAVYRGGKTPYTMEGNAYDPEWELFTYIPFTLQRMSP